MKKEVNENKKEKKDNLFLKAYNIFIADPDSLSGEIPGLEAFFKVLYNICIADPDSLSGEIPGLEAISKDIEDNGTDEDKKIIEALQESEKRIDDKVFKASLKVTPAKVRALENDKKDNSNKKKNKEEKEISK